MSVSEAVQSEIDDQLDQIEGECGVTVLYACESGSRAWGFPSTNSDYDVRFVYVHPRDWYVSIDLERRDDTIDPDREDELDLHGWDLRKALQLFRVANPTLLEWIRSPIVYRADESVMAGWRALLPDFYTPPRLGPAYRGMARSVAAQNLGDEPIKHKAYLYVLRALLAVRWIEQDRGLVPVPFTRLLDATVTEPDLRRAIEALLSQKRGGNEADAGPRLPVIHDFIEAELDRQEALSFPQSDAQPQVEPLNEFFRSVLDQHG